MKSHRFAFAVAFLTLIYFVTCLDHTALAATKPKAPQDVQAVKTKVIKSVDAKASTVTIQYMFDKTTHVYKIDDLTKVKVNNQDGKLADIKVGMVVEDYLERDNDDLDELSLSGYGTPATPAAKPKAPAKPKPTPTT